MVLVVGDFWILDFGFLRALAHCLICAAVVGDDFVWATAPPHLTPAARPYKTAHTEPPTRKPPAKNGKIDSRFN